MRYLLLLCMTLAAGSAPAFAAETPPQPANDANAVYDRAAAALESDRYADAIPDLHALKERYPSDPVIRSKLIIAYENSGDVARRDMELEELIKLHSSMDNPKFHAADAFQRDSFHLDKRSVGVVKYFDLIGERPIIYSFVFFPATRGGPGGRRITLGSYEADTLAARQRGEIGPTERIYHLDETTEQGHLTWSMYRGEPSYDSLKKQIIDIFKGERKPISSSISRQKN
jgi:hypothetical protein